MALVPIELVRAGTTTRGGVCNAAGIVLVQAGVVLTEPLIARLRKYGVRHVDVVGDGAAAEQPADTEKLVAEAKGRFAGHEQDPLMMALQDTIVAQLKQSPIVRAS